MSKIIFSLSFVLILFGIFPKLANAQQIQTFHDPNPVFVNSGTIFVYVISDQTFADVTYSFRAWKDGTSCTIGATTDNPGSGRLEKVKRADGTLYQFTASWNIVGCRASEGIWHFQLWAGAGEGARNDSTLIVRDYPFEMQTAGGQIPFLTPVKKDLSLSETPEVLLNNARTTTVYTFWWDGSKLELAHTPFTAPTDGLHKLQLNKSPSDFFNTPGTKRLCMAIGDYRVPTSLRCQYTADFNFSVISAPPTAPSCSMNKPNLTVEDDVGITASGLALGENFTATLGIPYANFIQNSGSTGTVAIQIGSKLPEGDYTAYLYDSSNKEVCPPLSFKIGPKAAITAFPSATPCTGAGCTKAGGDPCGDPGNPGFKTAIGCIHTNPIEFTKDALKFIIGIGGGLAFLMMLLGAFQMLTSAGNPETLQTGRDRLTNAIIGLLFVIFATLLLQIIGFDILKLPGFGR